METKDNEKTRTFDIALRAKQEAKGKRQKWVKCFVDKVSAYFYKVKVCKYFTAHYCKDASSGLTVMAIATYK